VTVIISYHTCLVCSRPGLHGCELAVTGRKARWNLITSVQGNQGGAD